MAGLIDTDGTIGIYYKKDSGYQSSLEFYNDSQQLMKWVVEHFGGTYKPKKDPRRGTLGYRWSPQGRLHLCRFLDEIMPYLVFKKSEASILRQFLSLSGECPDYRKYLTDTCKFIKGKRSIVETDTLRSFSNLKPNLKQAYIAGLIDGDGNIDCYDYSPYVVIAITNMCKAFFDVLVGSYGGNYYKCKPTTYRWQLSGAFRQENFLLKILPYLVFKQDKAKNALNLVRERIKVASTQKFGRPLDKLMIQPELIGDYESEPMGTLVS